MRFLHFLICLCGLALPTYPASTTVTVAQLEHFLTSSRAAKLSDKEIAERLSRVDLSEELTSRSMARILAETSPGPETELQLEILAAASLLQSPPAAELPNEFAPDPEKQKEILGSARDYAGRSLHILPDLVAVRETRSFTNVPSSATRKRQRPRVEMHFASEGRREVAVRKGREVVSAVGGQETSDNIGLSSGLSSWGEFGAMLTVIFGDSSDNSIHWRRWQTTDSGIRLAVFAYEIPRSDSHYTVDFCCYRESEDDPVRHAFKDKPAYHGEIYIDPGSGEITGITLEAELSDSDPVSRSAIAVQYAHVMIGGRSYECPVRSVAITELYNADMQKDYGIGVERHVNEVEFTHYRKFGSTARIITSTDGIEHH